MLPPSVSRTGFNETGSYEVHSLVVFEHTGGILLHVFFISEGHNYEDGIWRAMVRGMRTIPKSSRFHVDIRESCNSNLGAHEAPTDA